MHLDYNCKDNLQRNIYTGPKKILMWSGSPGRNVDIQIIPNLKVNLFRFFCHICMLDNKHTNQEWNFVYLLHLTKHSDFYSLHLCKRQGCFLSLPQVQISPQMTSFVLCCKIFALQGKIKSNFQRSTMNLTHQISAAEQSRGLQQRVEDVPFLPPSDDNPYFFSQDLIVLNLISTLDIYQTRV